MSAKRGIGSDCIEEFGSFFFDDDVELHKRYIERSLQCLISQPDAILLSGEVLAEGHQHGLARTKARAIVAADEEEAPSDHDVSAIESAYGCNMVFRMRFAPHLRFDERLRNYAYLEDFDFSRRAANHGVILKVAAARLVHLRVAGGRWSAQQRGYASVMNPAYLRTKGVWPYGWGRLWARSFPRALANHAIGTLFAPPDHRHWEQLLGVLAALRDLLRGKVQPERVTRLP